MSETSRGAGWWLASDGRWYPPELHPSHRAAATLAVAPAAATSPQAAVTTTLQAAPPTAAGIRAATAPGGGEGGEGGEDEGQAADRLFRRMLRTVVEHYTAGTGKSSRRVAAAAAGTLTAAGDAGTAAATGDAGAAAATGDAGTAGTTGAAAATGLPSPARGRPVASSAAGLAGHGVPDPTASPFAPVPDLPAPSPLSLRRRTPQHSASSGDPSLVAAPTTRHLRCETEQAFRRDLVLGPASLAPSTERRHRRVLPLGAIFLVLVMAAAAGVGGYVYQHRSTPSSSPVDAAKAFVRALYDDSPQVAQSMLVPGQHLDVPAHHRVSLSFDVTSVTPDGADRDVNALVCATPNGQGCGAQSGNGDPVVVPTRLVGGSWYVDQSRIIGCPGGTSRQVVALCQA